MPIDREYLIRVSTVADASGAPQSAQSPDDVKARIIDGLNPVIAKLAAKHTEAAAVTDESDLPHHALRLGSQTLGPEAGEIGRALTATLGRPAAEALMMIGLLLDKVLQDVANLREQGSGAGPNSAGDGSTSAPGLNAAPHPSTTAPERHNNSGDFASKEPARASSYKTGVETRLLPAAQERLDPGNAAHTGPVDPTAPSVDQSPAQMVAVGSAIAGRRVDLKTALAQMQKGAQDQDVFASEVVRIVESIARSASGTASKTKQLDDKAKALADQVANQHH